MVDCILSLPLSAWRFENDIWGHMTLQTWNSCRGHCVGDCDEVRDFMEDLGYKLNRISSRGDKSNKFVNLFYSHLERFGDLQVILTTSDDSISVKSFMEIVKSSLVDIFSNIDVKSHYNKLVFDKDVIDSCKVSIKPTRSYLVERIERSLV